MEKLKHLTDEGSGRHNLATKTRDILVYADEDRGRVRVEVFQKGKSRYERILETTVRKRPA